MVIYKVKWFLVSFDLTFAWTIYGVCTISRITPCQFRHKYIFRKCELHTLPRHRRTYSPAASARRLHMRLNWLSVIRSDIVGGRWQEEPPVCSRTLF